MRRAVLTILLIALGSPAALAGKAEGQACAATLTQPGKQMYEVVAPHVAPGKDIADTIRAQIRPLVMGGKLSRTDAQGNAKAVKACLEKLAG